MLHWRGSIGSECPGLPPVAMTGVVGHGSSLCICIPWATVLTCYCVLNNEVCLTRNVPKHKCMGTSALLRNLLGSVALNALMDWLLRNLLGACLQWIRCSSERGLKSVEWLVTSQPPWSVVLNPLKSCNLGNILGAWSVHIHNTYILGRGEKYVKGQVLWRERLQVN
jgi:hypothetical protein